MKPCSKNRKLIAWLALDALDVRQKCEIRAHLESCEGCRQYLAEISNVTERLRAVETSSAIPASEILHQNVMTRLKLERPATPWQNVMAQLRWPLPNWGMSLAAMGAIVVAIAALSVLARRPGAHSLAPAGNQAVVTASTNDGLDPTLSNYQTVANQSLEELDELLTRQGTRGLAPVPIYTASTLTRVRTQD